MAKMDEKTAKEMASYIAKGVSHFDTMQEKQNVVMDILDRYGVLEKEKVGDKVFGNIEFDKEKEGSFELEDSFELESIL